MKLMPNSKPKIEKISCHKIVNSRGDWTIATKVLLTDGSVGVQTIPDGASKGEHEAHTIPPEKAVQVVSSVLNDALQSEDPFDQKNIDNTLLELDGTPNKSHLGANSLLSVSLAVARSTAQHYKIELFERIAQIYENKLALNGELKFPTPVFNILNGGKHANNGLSFQEFMIIPSPKVDYDRSVSMGIEIYHLLKKELQLLGKATGVGDEGGFAPSGFNPETALEILRNSVSRKYKPGDDVFFGMDVASGSFYNGHSYVLPEIGATYNVSQMNEYYGKLLKKFELLYIEDPFYENDIDGWKSFYTNFSGKVMVVGDDLVVTNPKLLSKYSKNSMLNAVIVKPNQIGTLTETLDFIKIAQSHKMGVIVSHRSGDTAEDTFISDLAVGTSADFIKSGAPARGERVAKYNRLLDIYDMHRFSK